MAPYNNTPGSRTRNGRPAGRVTGAGALAGGALFVGLIALCALVISYNGIFQFAEYGGHAGSALAHVFPVTYTLLLIMACWVSYLLRGAHPRERLWVDLVLIPALIMFATAAMLLSNLELVERVPEGIARVVVAVAPLAALLVAFLLWMTVRAHMRRRRRTPTARPRPSDDPATVLQARAVVSPARVPDEPDDAALRTRLLRLGPDDRDTEAADGARSHEAGEFVRIRPRSEATAVPERNDDGSEATGDLRHDEPDEPDEMPEDDREDGPEEHRNAAGPIAAPVPVQASPPGHGRRGDEDDEASAPTFPLPRRSRSGHNPIKLAAEQPPVVPGAAAPGPEFPEDRSGGAAAHAHAHADAGGPVEAVPDHLADEGFDHEPPPGDPASDEAEAPAALPVPGGEPEAVGGEGSVPVAETASAPAARTPAESASRSEDPDHGPHGEDRGYAEHEGYGGDGPDPHGAVRGAVPAPVAGTGAGTPSGTGADGAIRAAGADAWDETSDRSADGLTDGPADAVADAVAEGSSDLSVDGPADDGTGPGDGRVPATALWEPPASADTGAGVLSDYVPPVWTPPEDDGPADEDRVEPDPEPAPVLDHDTGPTVRAAFRIPQAPPETVGPTPAPTAPEPAEPHPAEAAPVPGTGDVSAREGVPGPGPGAPEGEPDVEPGEEPLPEVEELPSAFGPGAEPETRAPSDREAPEDGAGSRADRPGPERLPLTKRSVRTPVEKRPMVLKPPRPPLPDFAAGPPSRRVRSEPLRPDE
ncbi:DUF2637 domain-containing protein [Streptomonospora nanhaiensis]|uniref:DUF2637 domain-containing protein n=1 Tax=Streptomonospora nanhaiensis TaxID=1323731 RepID=A0ABY6YQC7_9ACTN|nr:DUF2637 domain-containing protein [Streptomonospora nanhaiensis]WAE74030.1 DUF2637 domain-containing protein [Streptomonospora nanhaiensis]